ncbi:MAG: hypothetical protein COB38_11615, partial [Gammaproteobacteria bacterium]
MSNEEDSIENELNLTNESKQINQTSEGSNMSDSNSELNAMLAQASASSETAMMMVDRDLKITYLNNATNLLLKALEPTLKEIWSDFEATSDYMIGKCIDDFHANPAHQRKILGDPANLPYQTNIKLGVKTVRLNVAAIVDASGEYVGSSLEWADVTAEVASKNEIARMEGAMAGSATATMMVDRDLLITYMNPATETLLKTLEPVMKGIWSDFSADRDFMMGKCIDDFHANPAHQRKILDDPANLPYQTNIKLGDQTVRLNVAAIMDGSGTYVGSSLEWENVTSQVDAQIEIGRLVSATQGMTTNLMMADADGVINYMNPSLEKMLSRREKEIQKALPVFSVAKCVGTNFDSFHANPAHQRNLLQPENLPYSTKISVGVLTFGLTAIALFDEENNYLGTAVEWSDETEVVNAQIQVENLINDAVEGKLDTRINADEFDGFLKRAKKLAIVYTDIEGVNSSSFDILGNRDWSNAWQAEAIEHIRTLKSVLADVAIAADKFEKDFGANLKLSQISALD